MSDVDSDSWAARSALPSHGSIIGTAYSRDMTGAPDGASESVGAAHAIADRVGGVPGRDLADQAAQAFTGALGVGLTAAAAVALVGALLRAPAPARRAGVRPGRAHQARRRGEPQPGGRLDPPEARPAGRLRRAS